MERNNLDILAERQAKHRSPTVHATEHHSLKASLLMETQVSINAVKHNY
jgi:hypothetical protein